MPKTKKKKPTVKTLTGQLRRALADRNRWKGKAATAESAAAASEVTLLRNGALADARQAVLALYLFPQNNGGKPPTTDAAIALLKKFGDENLAKLEKKAGGS